MLCFWALKARLQGDYNVLTSQLPKNIIIIILLLIIIIITIIIIIIIVMIMVKVMPYNLLTSPV